MATYGIENLFQNLDLDDFEINLVSGLYIQQKASKLGIYLYNKENNLVSDLYIQPKSKQAQNLSV